MKFRVIAALFCIAGLMFSSSRPITAQQPDIEAPPTESGDVEACAAKEKTFQDWTDVAGFTCASGWKSAGSFYDPVDGSCTLLYKCGGRTNWLNVRFAVDGTITVSYWTDSDPGQLSGEPDIEGPGPGDESGEPQATPECEQFHRALLISDGTTSYGCQEPGFELRTIRKIFSSSLELLKCEGVYKCPSSGVYLLVTYDYKTGDLDVKRIS